MKIDKTLSLKNKAKGCLKGCGMVSAAIFCFFIIIAVIMSLIPDSSEDLHLKAIDLYKSGNYQKALLENNNAIKKDSNNYKYHFLNTKLHWELRDTIASNQSLTKVEKLIKGDSITFEVNKELLEWRISKNDTVEAEKVIKHLLKIYSLDDFDNYSKAFYYSADKFHFFGKPILRDKLLQELIDSTSIKRLDTSNFKTTYYRVSKEFFKYEDTLQGVELLKKLIEKIPSSKQAYNQLGNYYYKKNNDKTISYFKEYIKHDSLNATVYRKIGLSYLDKNFKKSAKKYLAISANKGDKEACFSLRELTAKTKYYTRSICWDGTTSSSTGRGTCSHHGGVRRIEYVPYKVYTIDCK